MNARTRTVPSVDLREENAYLLDAAPKILERVISGGRFILGDIVEEFERQAAAACGTKHAVGVNSGTDALVIALHALGVGHGSEVVTVANSFVATTAAIVRVGATPVFCDVGEDELMDVDAAAAAVTARTAAIVVVHLRGRVAKVDELRELARRVGVPLVEDASQAFLGRYAGMPAGSIGDVGCFSLHPLKNPGALGDGGFLVTNDDKVAERTRRLRNHGLENRDTCLEWGFNSRLDALQAAFLNHKLDVAPQALERRASHAARYTQGLADSPLVALPVDVPNTASAHYSYVIRLDVSQRDPMRDHLRSKGVEALIHYPVPIHLQPAARDLGWRRGSLPVTERQATEILSLPLHSSMSADDVDYVVEAVLDFRPAGRSA